MSMVCVLCDAPTGLRAIGAMIVVGDPSNPDGAIVCRACAALPETEQKRRRDLAMTRMIDGELARHLPDRGNAARPRA